MPLWSKSLLIHRSLFATGSLVGIGWYLQDNLFYSSLCSETILDLWNSSNQYRCCHSRSSSSLFQQIRISSTMKTIGLVRSIRVLESLFCTVLFFSLSLSLSVLFHPYSTMNWTNMCFSVLFFSRSCSNFSLFFSYLFLLIIKKTFSFFRLAVSRIMSTYQIHSSLSVLFLFFLLTYRIFIWRIKPITRKKQSICLNSSVFLFICINVVEKSFCCSTLVHCILLSPSKGCENQWVFSLVTN